MKWRINKRPAAGHLCENIFGILNLKNPVKPTRCREPGTSHFGFFGGIFGLIFLLLFALLPAAPAHAAGFYLPGRGVHPMGRAGASIASGAGDLNSLWYNPANLTLSDGLKLTVDTAFVDLSAEFTRAPRVNDEGDTHQFPTVSSDTLPQPIPQALVGGPTGVEGLSWAAGAYAPYTSGATYPEDGPQRYSLITNTGSVMLFLNAALAYQIGDSVRVGAGVQNVIAQIRVVNMTSGYTGLHGQAEDPELDILSEIQMSDYFIPTGNLGVWVKLGGGMEAAASFQGPVIIKDKNAQLKTRMPASPEFDNARLSDSSLSTQMQLPMVARAALRYAADSYDIEAAMVWEGWSSFDEIRATPNNMEVEGVPGIHAIPVGPMSIPQNLQDSISLRLGGGYELNPAWSLRAGLGFESSAFPDEYYSVLMPESDKYHAALGATWTLGEWSIDAGAAYFHYADRHITNSKVRQVNPIDVDNELASVIANGDYSARYLVFGLGLNYLFGAD